MAKFQSLAVRSLAAIASATLVSACGGQRSEPHFVYMPDMWWQPSIKAQEVGGMRRPPEGTVPRGFEPYPYANNPEAAGANLRNPLGRTKAVYYKGKELYESACIVCHGPAGYGKGYVVPKYPQPPSLHSNKIRNWPDGRIFHVITNGQNTMGPYSTQFDPEERWAIIRYIRALQRANNPSASDLQRAKNW
jgi:mono/diheme cytochrome c family protein